MEQSLTSVINCPTTKFDSEVLLEPKQFSEYWDLFPFKVRKSLNKTKKGELPHCSDEELKVVLDRYLQQNECGCSSSIKCAE
jgi:hypothetical protein